MPGRQLPMLRLGRSLRSSIQMSTALFSWFLVLSALEEELAALRESTLVAVNDVTAGGVLLEDHLRAMPARVRMLALSEVCHEAALALAMISACLNLAFVGVDEEKEELTSDFTAAMEAIVVATHVGDIILTAFFEP